MASPGINTAIVSQDPGLAQQFIIIRDNQLALQNYLKSALNTEISSSFQGELVSYLAAKINISTVVLTADTAITAGNLIGFNAGKARPALLPNYPAYGYALETVAAGALVKVVLWDGVITSSGLTPGTKYYTSTTVPGAFTASTSGDCIGIAMSATEILFHAKGF